MLPVDGATVFSPPQETSKGIRIQMELKATILLSKKLILIFALLFYSQGDLDKPKNRSISELVGSWHITPTDHVPYQYELTRARLSER